MGIGKIPIHPNDLQASHLSPYITPYFQLERGKWQATLSLPLSNNATSRNSVRSSSSIRPSICAISRTTIGRSPFMAV